MIKGLTLHDLLLRIALDCNINFVDHTVYLNSEFFDGLVLAVIASIKNKITITDRTYQSLMEQTAYSTMFQISELKNMSKRELYSELSLRCRELLKDVPNIELVFLQDRLLIGLFLAIGKLIKEQKARKVETDDNSNI